jgi:hypothetical protein
MMKNLKIASAYIAQQKISHDPLICGCGRVAYTH